MELLGAEPGSPGLEEHDRVGAAREVRQLLRASSPGRLATLRGCQFTADVECSMSIHGLPAASERVRSASIARQHVRVGARRP